MFPSDWHTYLGVHEIILYFVVALLISALGGGPLLKTLFNWVLKLVGHSTSETIVNVEVLGGEMAVKQKPVFCATCGITDPASCPLHMSEHERSLRNEKSIKELWANYGDLRKEMITQFKEVQGSINTSQSVIIQNQTKILEAVGKRPRNWKTDKEDGK